MLAMSWPNGSTKMTDIFKPDFFLQKLITKKIPGQRRALQLVILFHALYYNGKYKLLGLV